MKKNDIYAFVAIALIAIFATACTKSSSSSSTTSSKLIGKWTIVRLAIDNNNNGVADPGEWFVASSLGISGYIQFNSNNTGVRYSNSPLDSPAVQNTNFTWSLANNDTYILVTDSGKTSASGIHIDTLTANTLVAKDTSGGQASWYSVTK